MKRSDKPLTMPKDGLLKNSPTKIGEAMRQGSIKDADNSTRQRKLVSRTPKVTDQLTDAL